MARRDLACGVELDEILRDDSYRSLDTLFGTSPFSSAESREMWILLAAANVARHAVCLVYGHVQSVAVGKLKQKELATDRITLILPLRPRRGEPSQAEVFRDAVVNVDHHAARFQVAQEGFP